MRVVCCSLLVFVACCVGCSSNVPVSGTVTFSDDGSPVPAGTVCFVNDAVYARGTLDENGRYTLGFKKPGDGIPPGAYGVCVTGAKKPLGMRDEFSSVPGSKGGTMMYEELVAPKFHSRTTSGITCTVDASTKTFDFKVERAKANKPPR